jgi:phage gp29-like protein
MSVKTGIAVIESIAGRLGVSFDAESELAAITEQQNLTDSKDLSGLKPQKITEAVADGSTKHVLYSKTTIDPPEQMTGLLSQTAQPLVDSMVDAARGLLYSVDSLPEYLTKLDELFPGMDLQDLTEVMTEPFLAADLAGRFDVLRGE